MAALERAAKRWGRAAVIDNLCTCQTRMFNEPCHEHGFDDSNLMFQPPLKSPPLIAGEPILAGTNVMTQWTPETIKSFWESGCVQVGPDFIFTGPGLTS